MFSTKRIAVALALAALVAAGCSSADVAATVNDDEIPASSVFPLAGLDPDNLHVSGDDFRGSLTLLILQNALAQAAAEDYGLGDPTTDEARSTYFTNAPSDEQLAINQAADTGASQGRDRQAAFDYVVTQQIIGTTVRQGILHDEALLRLIYDTTPEVLITMCVSHILVSSEEEADEVLARLAAGEAFADLAAEVSLDTQSPGGALECPSSPYALGDSFGDGVIALEVGLAPEPVATQFGYHVILVESKESPASFEDLVANPELYVPNQIIENEYSIWLDEAVERASIIVRSNIGTWLPQADGISPPAPSP